MKKIVPFFVVLFGFLPSFGQKTDSLTIQLQKIAEESGVKGFGVAVVSKDKVLYQKGFGYSDMVSKTPYTEHTVQNLCSITKTLIAFGLMKLIDEGKVRLNDPIDSYLSFKIANPHFPLDKITLRHLATHTSSLTDGKDDLIIEKSYLFDGDINFNEKELPEGYYPYFKIYQKNKAISLEKFLKNAYMEEGVWYDKDNFVNSRPGTTYHYTNIGATLLAFIIEQVSGEKFSDVGKKELFEPLQMNNSYWRLKDIPKEELACLYLSNGLRIPHYELITYPDGGWFTSIADFSKYLIEMIKGINGESHLLSHKSYKEMMSNQLIKENFPNGNFESSKGLMWSVNKDGDNISMNGADPGVLSYTLFTTQGNVGIVIFMNTSIYDKEELESDFKKIRATLFQNVKRLLNQ